MNSAVPEITLQGLLLAFVPTAVVIGIMLRWRSTAGTALYATARMLVQLLLIGYVLIYIFETDRWYVIAAVLAVMLGISSWIAIRPLEPRDTRTYLQALAAISFAGVLTLGLVTQLVIDVAPWFSPRFVVPLAGMIFAGSMNAVSLAAERFEAECGRGISYREARRTALQAALIPMINSLFAVGLVALPGMMTGQILSGVSPLIAAKYQIVVMTMLFGANGIAAATYLVLRKPSASTAPQLVLLALLCVPPGISACSTPDAGQDDGSGPAEAAGPAAEPKIPRLAAPGKGKTDLDPGLDALIQAASADVAERLAGRQGNAGPVTVLRAERVTWRSGALGCPLPDRAYTMVLTPGVLIRLRAGSAIFEYHSTLRGPPFLCEPPGRIETPELSGNAWD